MVEAGGSGGVAAADTGVATVADAVLSLLPADGGSSVATAVAVTVAAALTVVVCTLWAWQQHSMTNHHDDTGTARRAGTPTYLHFAVSLLPAS